MQRVNMRFKNHFSRRTSASYITSLPSSRKGSISVSIVAEPPLAASNPKMSARNSTISMSDASFGPRGGRDISIRYLRRPNLAQILADEAPTPWTLEAFTAYAARNLCSENIEFIQDARRYKAAYRTMMGQQEAAAAQGHRPTLHRANSGQVEKLKELWTRLIINYIAPSSPREINLTADIRSGLLPHNKQLMPPSPRLLDPAIKKIEELIEDSILFSFLSEVQSSVNPSLYQPSADSEEGLALDTGFQPADKFARPPSVSELISPLSDAPIQSPLSATTRSPRHSQHVYPPTTGSMSHKGSTASNSNSIAAFGSAANSIAPALSEDSSSVVSPTTSQHEQRTPPRTPPGTDSEAKRSPKNNDRWKRMSQRFGFSRKSGTALKDVLEDHPPLP